MILKHSRLQWQRRQWHPTPVLLPGKSHRRRSLVGSMSSVQGVAKSRTRLSDFTLTFHFHALEKEMATHSSVLAWRIPGMRVPGELPSKGLHRVGHDWGDLAAAADCSGESKCHYGGNSKRTRIRSRAWRCDWIVAISRGVASYRWTKKWFLEIEFTPGKGAIKDCRNNNERFIILYKFSW